MYSPRGGRVLLRLRREERDRGLWGVIEVIDEGIGIPSQDLEHVFDPYFRGTNIGPNLSGTGIGLSGTRGIVLDHGGEITAESVEHEGTSVTVCLPLILDVDEFS